MYGKKKPVNPIVFRYDSHYLSIILVIVLLNIWHIHTKSHHFRCALFSFIHNHKQKQLFSVFKCCISIFLCLCLCKEMNSFFIRHNIFRCAPKKKCKSLKNRTNQFQNEMNLYIHNSIYLNKTDEEWLQ